MVPKKAIYPGRFDPITYGHIDIIRRAQKLFSELTIAIVMHPKNPSIFSSSERVEITRDALASDELGSIRVLSYDQLLIELATELGADAIVRGLRANSEFDYEFQMALTNRDLAPEIETVFFMTAGQYSFLSSSIVNEVKYYGGDVSSFVPPNVERALEQKLSHAADSASSQSGDSQIRGLHD